MTEKAHFHAGHRERLREQLLSAGTDIFRAHQILEFLLFYPVPRIDTNNLAHALIEHFGSASRVLTARESELTAVRGIGAHTAKFITDYRAFVTGALEEPCDPPNITRINPEEMIRNLVLDHYEKDPSEHAILLLINNKLDVYAIETIADGSIHSARFHPKNAVQLALDRHASLAIVAHNRPGGLAVPTSEDRYIAEELERHFAMIGIKLLNHFLYANGRIAGLLHKEEKEASSELPLHFSATFSADAFINNKLPYSNTAVFDLSNEAELSIKRQKRLLARLLSYTMSEEKANEWSERAFFVHPHLQAICSQSLEWLEASGLSRGAAALLKLALPSYAACLLKSHRDIPLSDASSIGSAMTLRCMTLTGESVFLILFDEKMRQVAFSRVSDGVVNSAEVSTRRVAESAYFSHARYAVLVHNHPFGTTAASQNDIFSTYLFSETLDMVNCTLLEHLIVSGNRFSPLLLLLKENEAPGFDVKGFYSALFLRDFPNIKK